MAAEYSGIGVTRVSSAQIDVHKVSIPLMANVKGEREGSLYFLFSSSLPKTRFKARIYVGVKVETFHHVLRAPWPWFRDAFLRGNIFGDGCIRMEEMKEEEILEGAKVEVAWERPRIPDLGPAPRERYPLVLCAMTMEDGEVQDEDPLKGSAIGAMIHAVHIRDEVIRMPTGFLSSHAKHMDGRVTNLQQLFVEKSDEGQPSENELGSSNSSMCVVCQDKRATRAMLPCKHACSCSRCFERLRDRYSVTSYSYV